MTAPTNVVQRTRSDLKLAERRDVRGHGEVGVLVGLVWRRKLDGAFGFKGVVDRKRYCGKLISGSRLIMGNILRQ